MFSVVKLPVMTHPVLNTSSILSLMGNFSGKKTYEEELKKSKCSFKKDLHSVRQLKVEGDSQNLPMINGHFKTVPGHFFDNYINIFHKTKVETVI